MPAFASPVPSACADARYAGSLPVREPQKTATECISVIVCMWPSVCGFANGFLSRPGILMGPGRPTVSHWTDATMGVIGDDEEARASSGNIFRGSERRAGAGD